MLFPAGSPYRSHMAHIGQARPDSGLGYQVKGKTFEHSMYSLGNSSNVEKDLHPSRYTPHPTYSLHLSPYTLHPAHQNLKTVLRGLWGASFGNVVSVS